MTGSRKKITAVLFAALMVTSFFAVGLVAADTTNRPDTGPDTYFPANSTGNVTSGATVYQGEEQVTFNQTDFGVSALDLQPDADESLDITSDQVPDNKETGVYTTDTDQGTAGEQWVRVQQPDISDMDVINPNGVKVGAGSVQENQNIVVTADWNYKRAEDIEISVEDEDGFEVTGDVLTNVTPTSSQNTTSDGINDAWGGQAATRIGNGNLSTAQQGIGNTNLGTNQFAAWGLSFNDMPSGEYTIIVEGIEDFEEGEGPDSAVDSTTLDVTTTDDAELSLESDSATQGERVQYTIENSVAGANHTVAIDADDLRDNVNIGNANVFRDVGDVDESANDGSNWLWANLTIDDDGVAVGQIDTQYLDDTSVDIKLFDSTYDPSTLSSSQLANNEVDEATLNVEQGTITIDNPGRSYVPGQEIDLNGTASEGLDEIALYTRDQGDWHLIAQIGVDSDGTWEEDNFVLSPPSEANSEVTSEAANILALPGIYRLGAIDVQDADLNGGGDGNADNNLTTQEFSTGLSIQRSIRIAEPTLSGQFMTYNGEAFIEEEIEYNGTAVGANTIVRIFSGSNGNSNAEAVSVDDDDEFDGDYGWGDTDSLAVTRDTSISEGRVAAALLSAGRDQVFGDGSLETIPGSAVPAIFPNNNPEATVDHMVSAINLNSGQGYTLEQRADRLLQQTVNDAGSDDLVVTQRFRLAGDSATAIRHVVPSNYSNATGVNPIEVGETAVVRGITNIKPDDNTIVVEAIEGPDNNKIPVETTSEWDRDGEWSLMIDVPTDVTPGNYTLQADDGYTSDQVELEIMAEGERGPIQDRDDQQLQNQIDELQSQVDNLENQNEELQNQVSDLESRNEQLEQNNSELRSRLDEQDDGTGQPGFTPLVAIVALIGAALLALRRRD